MRSKLYSVLAAFLIFGLTTHQLYAQTASSLPARDGLVTMDLATITSANTNANANTPDMPIVPHGEWNSVDELVNYAAYTINYYWEGEFQRAGLPYTPPHIFGSYTEPVQLACGSTLMNNAGYCFDDHSITYDYYFLDKQWKDHGDFAPVTIIAHEWGHLVQAHFGLQNQQLAELQADCFAGAYTQAAAQWGLLEPGDLEGGAASLYAGGKPNTPWFGHGTPEQRIQAFEYGLQYGIAPCIQFYTGGSDGSTVGNNFSGTVHTVYLPLVEK